MGKTPPQDDNPGVARRSVVTTLASATALGLTGLAAAPASAASLGGNVARRTSNVSYRPHYHFSVPDNWKNDPQRPIHIDGEYLYYYLYNRDYIQGGAGTSWRLATTTDHVHFSDRGVALEKSTNANGDCWSGSLVVDQNNTAGYGKGAVIALVTQAPDGVQAQYLWYSTDKGRSFKPGGLEPVLPNPGTHDFRDPKVIWDSAHSQWVLLNAEGDRIGIYTSRNLKKWKRTGEFVETGLGLLECPDLFRIRSSDGKLLWVLGVSANGKPRDLPATYAYWVGSFDGASFTTRDSEPQWLDWGFDFYGAVTYPDYDENGKENPSLRRVIGWANFWDYPHNAPSMAVDGYNGDDMIVREVRMVSGHDGYYLASVPVSQLRQLAGETTRYKPLRVTNSLELEVSHRAYELECELVWDADNPPENVGFELCRAKTGTRHVAAGLYLAEGFAYLNRKPTHNPGDKSETQSPISVPEGRIRVRILVDTSSVEVFFGDGRIVHSHRVFPLATDTGIKLFVAGGEATFNSMVVRELSFR